MVSVSSICVEFSGHSILDNISFSVNPKDRIGLTGKNGAGKSTLLKIIAGANKPTSGKIVVPTDETIGYLPQDMKFTSNHSIYDETLQAFAEVIQLEKDIERLTNYISDAQNHESDEYMDSITELTEKSDRYNYLGGHKIESHVERILKGLGFSENDFHRNIQEFSGGWQMRVELAKLLLRKPNLLLLDEPTNHLDIESILWVEEFLASYPGAVMMVSHDRQFLDNITNRTLDIVLGDVHDYNLPYSKYLVARDERLSQQQAAFDNQQKYIDQQEKFITRFRAKATKSRQVQSKIKLLDKLDRVEVDETDTSTVSIKFPEAPRSGKIVVETAGLSKSYREKNILNNIAFTIEKGEKIAFVGRNGEGKSTLSKIIAGKETCEGAFTLGYNVSLGYYAQIQEKSLNEDFTVYETIEHEAVGEWSNATKIRSLLGAFLFGEKAIDKKVKVLSGGEKSRLAMARLLLQPCNLLILDEPTNHLDISSQKILKEALLSFDGTLIVVSHDRDFLSGLTTRTFEFKNKQIKEHLGDIKEFLSKYQTQNFRDIEQGKGDKSNNNTSAADNEQSNKDKYLIKKNQEKELRGLQKQIKDAETRIEKAEKDMKEIEGLMETPEVFEDHVKVQEYTAKHTAISKQLEKDMISWETLQAELEEKQV